MAKDIIGLKIVGYRYGEAPEGGRSWNYRERKFECGVSMACVGYDKEIGSFAVMGASNRKKYYYLGTICGWGGDDEICLWDVKRLSYKEYLALKKQHVKESNAVVNYRIDRSISLINAGWNLGSKTIETLEAERKKYLKKEV